MISIQEFATEINEYISPMATHSSNHSCINVEESLNRQLIEAARCYLLPFVLGESDNSGLDLVNMLKGGGQVVHRYQQYLGWNGSPSKQIPKGELHLEGMTLSASARTGSNDIATVSIILDEEYLCNKIREIKKQSPRVKEFKTEWVDDVYMFGNCRIDSLPVENMLHAAMNPSEYTVDDQSDSLGETSRRLYSIHIRPTALPRSKVGTDPLICAKKIINDRINQSLTSVFGFVVGKDMSYCMGYDAATYTERYHTTTVNEEVYRAVNRAKSTITYLEKVVEQGLVLEAAVEDAGGSKQFKKWMISTILDRITDDPVTYLTDKDWKGVAEILTKGVPNGGK